MYEFFLKDFTAYFLSAILSQTAYEKLILFLDEKEVTIADKKYLRNSFRRVYSTEQHYKGLIGEHLFAFYYHKYIDDLLWAHGPKGRSSAEPGIDFITFTGDNTEKEKVKITVWEAKTTEKTISTKANEIYDFFQ